MAVIEAGGFYELDNGNVSQIPTFYRKNFNHTPVADTIQPLIDWAYITEPQVVSYAKLWDSNAHGHRVWQIVSFITLRGKRSAEGMDANSSSKFMLIVIGTGRNSNNFTRYVILL